MRRNLLLAVAAGTLVLGACSDQTSEPTVAPPSETFGTSCGVTPFPLLAIANQIKAIYPATPRAQALLRAEALLRAGAIKLAWDTCHPELARRIAFAFIDWLSRHTPPGKEAQVQDLIIAILRALEGATGTQSAGYFGAGVFVPGNGTQTIRSVNGRVVVQLLEGSFLERTLITISRKADNFKLKDSEGNPIERQFPPKIDYTATNASNQHELANGLYASVGFCLDRLEEFEEDIVPPGAYPPGGYPANIAIGHNPEPGTEGFPFEVLDPADVTAAELGLTDAVCGRSSDLRRIGAIGGFRGGPSAFATAAFQTAASYLGPIFMPQPLWATALAELPPPPPLTGKARSLSPFGVVESGEEFGFENGEAAWTGTVGGFWNRSTFVDVVNLAFDRYVSTVGNALPDPFAGSYSAWYGDPLTGNFLGEQAALDLDDSGGTSVAPNSGSFTSPEFTVPDVTNPVQLQLKTWWEIEGVNPATFDLMDIVLLHDGAETVLKRLNPPADPSDPNRSALAYTSAGFNVAPDWQDVAIDLSAYKGQIVQLKLVFATGDQNFNGFRGWIVDQVAVSILSSNLSVGLRANALQSAVDLVPADKMTFPARNK